MFFPLAGSLHYIPNLLLFCHAEEPGLGHKTHHMHETGWRGLAFAFMTQLVIILRNLSFAEAEILLQSYKIGSTSVIHMKHKILLFLLNSHSLRWKREECMY